MIPYSIAIKENSEKNLHILSNLPNLFLSWVFRQLPLGRLGLGFDVIPIFPYFVTCYDCCKKFWIVIEFIQQFLINFHSMQFLFKIISEQTLLPHVSFLKQPKNVLARAKYILTSSATSLVVIWQYFIITSLIFSTFSSVVDMLGRSGQSSSSTSSRLSLKCLYHS